MLGFFSGISGRIYFHKKNRKDFPFCIEAERKSFRFYFIEWKRACSLCVQGALAQFVSKAGLLALCLRRGLAVISHIKQRNCTGTGMGADGGTDIVNDKAFKP